MRKYYKIITDSKEADLVTVVDYNSNDIDIREYWNAKKVNEILAEKMEILVSTKYIDKTKYLANPQSLLIISKKLLNFLFYTPTDTRLYY